MRRPAPVRSVLKLRACWPLWWTRCDACGEEFRWERGMSWERRDYAETVGCVCACCANVYGDALRRGAEPPQVPEPPMAGEA